MFKGQKTLAALAVSLLFTAPVYAADEGSGEIHFKGEVTEAPFEIQHDYNCLLYTFPDPPKCQPYRMQFFCVITKHIHILIVKHE
ncbi:fimbrial-like adhesin protein [Escherichia coli]|nr:fimbrial-like adhesin protein [Escherichia coli]